MDEATARTHVDNLRSGERAREDAAFRALMAATAAPVPWAYAVWGDVVSLLVHPSNRVRAISAQVLSNLAKSDPDARILDDLPALMAVTRDERFVTARHCMQSLWKVGAAGDAQRAALLDALAERYTDCADEKNATLIRYDIIVALRRVFDATGDVAIRPLAERLIETEPDPKYRKKSAKEWKDA
jgi:hypothetical protein